jgi:hypothetical protein
MIAHGTEFKCLLKSISHAGDTASQKVTARRKKCHARDSSSCHTPKDEIKRRVREASDTVKTSKDCCCISAESSEIARQRLRQTIMQTAALHQNYRVIPSCTATLDRIGRWPVSSRVTHPSEQTRIRDRVEAYRYDKIKSNKLQSSSVSKRLRSSFVQPRLGCVSAKSTSCTFGRVETLDSAGICKG